MKKKFFGNFIQNDLIYFPSESDGVLITNHINRWGGFNLITIDTPSICNTRNIDFMALKTIKNYTKFICVDYTLFYANLLEFSESDLYNMLPGYLSYYFSVSYDYSNFMLLLSLEEKNVYNSTSILNIMKKVAESCRKDKVNFQLFLQDRNNYNRCIIDKIILLALKKQVKSTLSSKSKIKSIYVSNQRNFIQLFANLLLIISVDHIFDSMLSRHR